MVGPESAREAALRALVGIDEKNAYAQSARDRILDSCDLDTRDRAFCTELILELRNIERLLTILLRPFHQDLSRRWIRSQEMYFV